MNALTVDAIADAFPPIAIVATALILGVALGGWIERMLFARRLEQAVALMGSVVAEAIYPEPVAPAGEFTADERQHLDEPTSRRFITDREM